MYLERKDQSLCHSKIQRQPWGFFKTIFLLFKWKYKIRDNKCTTKCRRRWFVFEGYLAPVQLVARRRRISGKRRRSRSWVTCTCRSAAARNWIRRSRKSQDGPALCDWVGSPEDRRRWWIRREVLGAWGKMGWIIK